MLHHWTLIAMTTLTLPFLHAAVAADDDADTSASELMQRAIYAERTLGDLDQAIEIYGQIVATDEVVRPMAAQAQFRMGLCLLQKGDKAGARQAFERIEERFADQETVIEQAKRQLARLGSGSPGHGRRPANAAPLVVSTVPEAMDNAVPAKLNALKVTFIEPMIDGSWSWTGGGDTFPELAGKPSYDTERTTCRLPVKLEPGKVYWVGIIGPSHQNFKSTRGMPARRYVNFFRDDYVILFATADADGKPTPIPDDLAAQAQAINTAHADAATESDLGDALNLLDDQTRKDVLGYERAFASLLGEETAYKQATQAGQHEMVSMWIEDIHSDDQDRITEAVASLGNVRAVRAMPLLVDVLTNAKLTQKLGNRPRWIAVRGLGQIGQLSAAPALIDLLDDDNKNVRVYARLALAQISGEYFGDNKDRWKSWYERQSRVTAREVEEFRREGWQAFSRRDLVESESLYRKMLDKDATQSNGWQGLGWAQFNQGDSESAQASFDVCVDLEPTNSACLNGLGRIAKANDDVDAAMSYWKKAVQAAPNATASLMGLIETEMDRGNYAEAAKWCRAWLKVEPNSKFAARTLLKAEEAMASHKKESIEKEE